MCRFRERKRQEGEKKLALSRKSPEVIAAVFMRLCMCMLPEQGSTVVLGGPSNDQLLLPVHVLPGQTVATASQDPGHVKGLTQERKKNSAAIFTFDTLPQHICKDRWWENLFPHLSCVLVGRCEGAVGVSGVQTGPVHVAAADACLFQHFLKAVHAHVWPFHVLQELLGVEAGPFKCWFTSENVKMRLGLTIPLGCGSEQDGWFSHGLICSPLITL